MCNRRIAPSIALALVVTSAVVLVDCGGATQPQPSPLNEHIQRAGESLCATTLELVPRTAKVAKTLGVEVHELSTTLCRLPSVLDSVLSGRGNEVLPTLADEACAIGGADGKVK